jgi:DNA-binding MarR family transcriptional regulator
MPATRLSQLQKRILRWLAADAQRTKGVIASSHQELVRALQGDKSNISHSLRTLEARGWIVIGHSFGGSAESVILTPKGQNWIRSFTGSCDY